MNKILKIYFLIIVMLVFLILQTNILASIVSGKIIGEDGNPVDGACVNLAKGENFVHSTYSNDTGDFLFENIFPGDYTVIAKACKHYEQYAEWPQTKSNVFTVTDTISITDLKLIIPLSRFHFKGKVLTPDGLPVYNVLVQALIPPDGKIAVGTSGETKKDGTYRVDGIGKTGTFILSAKMGATPIQKIVTVSPEEKEINVDFTLQIYNLNIKPVYQVDKTKKSISGTCHMEPWLWGGAAMFPISNSKTLKLSSGTYKIRFIPDEQILREKGIYIEKSFFINSDTTIILEIITDQAESKDKQEEMSKKGKWIKAANMNEKRCRHTATLLQDGRVLVAGGEGRGMPKISCEIYYPLEDKWKKTRAMNSMRNDFSKAILLNDGRVLVVAGNSNSSQVFDPVNEMWSNVSRMCENVIMRGADITATLLRDGRVLVVGGGSTSKRGKVLASCEIYDLKTDTWSKTGSLNQGRTEHTATLLADGSVLVTGGALGYDEPNSSSCEVYDPVKGTWSMVNTMEKAGGQLAFLLSDGQVLVVKNPCELYNPLDKVWRITETFNTKKLASTKGTLIGDEVLIVGGWTGWGQGEGSTTNCEIYNPISNKWQKADNLSEKRWDEFTVTKLKDNRVLVTGGYNGEDLSSCEIYEP